MQRVYRSQPFVVFLLSVALPSAMVAANTQPSRAGLRLWLDASDETTLALDVNGAVTEWRDKSEALLPCTRAGNGHATLLRNALNGKPAVRFDGASAFQFPPIRAARGVASVFIVSRRMQEQASEHKWQRLLSSWDGTGPADNKGPSFCITGQENGSGGAYEATATYVSHVDVVLGAIAIGMNRKAAGGGFRGDIAEVLVYDRPFLAEDESRAVLDYLAAKWSAQISLTNRGWTRIGPLENPPRHLNDDYPLSDQENRGGWKRYEPMWDEFNGAALDTNKWHTGVGKWLGRQPAFFCRDNVSVHDGCLRLRMRKEECEEMQPHKAKGYHDYTSAAVESNTRVLYGYFEVRARPMKSAGSSSFWFAGMDPDDRHKAPNVGQEIDVFEIGGAAPGFARKYNMNAHATRYRDGNAEHWNSGGVWFAPWDFVDDFHVYGLEWNKKDLLYYVDGVMVRKQENICWCYPLRLIFDSETMPTWMGMPQDKDLPSIFSIDYVRAWTKK